jgi:hypothetical protein
MAGFVAGLDRGQATLVPECLEDWVHESNSVRAVDVFVEALDLRDLTEEYRRKTSPVVRTIVFFVPAVGVSQVAERRDGCCTIADPPAPLSLRLFQPPRPSPSKFRRVALEFPARNPYRRSLSLRPTRRLRQ